jgi:hypothetical protein
LKGERLIIIAKLSPIFVSPSAECYQPVYFTDYARKDVLARGLHRVAFLVYLALLGVVVALRDLDTLGYQVQQRVQYEP